MSTNMAKILSRQEIYETVKNNLQSEAKELVERDSSSITVHIPTYQPANVSVPYWNRIRFIGIDPDKPFDMVPDYNNKFTLENMLKVFGRPEQVHVESELGKLCNDDEKEITYLHSLMHKLAPEFDTSSNHSLSDLVFVNKQNRVMQIPDKIKLMEFLSQKLDVPEKECTAIANTITEPQNIKRCLVRSVNLVLFYNESDGTKVKLKVNPNRQKAFLGCQASYILPRYSGELDFLPRGIDSSPMFNQGLWLYREEDVSEAFPDTAISNIYWARMTARFNYLGKEALEEKKIEVPYRVFKDSYQVMQEIGCIRKFVDFYRMKEYGNMFGDKAFLFPEEDTLVMMDFKKDHRLPNGKIVDLDYLSYAPCAIMLAPLCFGLLENQKRDVVSAYLDEANRLTSKTFHGPEKDLLLHDINNSGHLQYILRELGGLSKMMKDISTPDLRCQIEELNNQFSSAYYQ